MSQLFIVPYADVIILDIRHIPECPLLLYEAYLVKQCRNVPKRPVNASNPSLKYTCDVVKLLVNLNSIIPALSHKPRYHFSKFTCSFGAIMTFSVFAQ